MGRVGWAGASGSRQALAFLEGHGPWETDREMEIWVQGAFQGMLLRSGGSEESGVRLLQQRPRAVPPGALELGQPSEMSPSETGRSGLRTAHWPVFGMTALGETQSWVKQPLT